MDTMKCYTLDIRQANKKLKNYFQNGCCAVAVAASTSGLNGGLDKLNTAGYQILDILYVVGFWVIVIKCTYELIQCALKGDKRGAGNSLMTYGMIFGSLYFVPWVMNIIKGVFSS